MFSGLDCKIGEVGGYFMDGAVLLSLGKWGLCDVLR